MQKQPSPYSSNLSTLVKFLHAEGKSKELRAEVKTENERVIVTFSHADQLGLNRSRVQNLLETHFGLADGVYRSKEIQGTYDWVFEFSA